MAKPIPVTSPLLPPLQEFLPYLEAVWESRRLTNGGPMHERLEQELANYLGVEHLCLFANGTLALVAALQALRISGEVITTPYSFVATAHSVLWNGLKPVFVDIDPVSCNLDPAQVEEAITPSTSAIMPVHCYGIPCDVEGIQRVADTYGLKVIYDAAHAFGVRQDGASILRSGDLSILSFHATKVFNTFEGGAIICPDAKIKKRIEYLKNFGFADEVTVVAPGINGKMNEVQAAFGLLQLKHLGGALKTRQRLFERYRQAFAGIPGLRMVSPRSDLEWNYSYCPLFVDEENFPISRDALFVRMRDADILARRYFYPLISEFPMYRGLDSAQPKRLRNAFGISRQVICLPIFPHMEDHEQDRVIAIVLRAAKKLVNG